MILFIILFIQVRLVIVNVLKDTFMCRVTVWKTLEERRQ